MKKSAAFLVIILVIFSGCGVQKQIRKADERYALGEYYRAGNLYRRAYRRIPAKEKSLRGQVAFKQAEAYRQISSPRAEMAYQSAVRNNYSDSLLFFRFAQVLQRNGKYADAVRNYQEFLKKDSTHTEALNGLQSARLAAEWAAESVQYKVAPFALFNANRTSSFSPAFAGSAGDVLVFSSMRKEKVKKTGKKSDQTIDKKIRINQVNGLPFSKLYIAKKNSKGIWEEPTLLEGAVNSENDEGVASFSADGSKMYFTRAQQFALEDAPTIIMVSQQSGGAWGEPQQLIFFADSTISVGHPAIAPDGVTLYFVSDAPNGVGGKDIWRGQIDGNEVKYLENLGNQVNTAQDEMFPTVAPDGTLYFSSNGHAGLGGLDLFKATENKDGQWTVESMRLPFNSRFDDFGLTISKNGLTGFFTSNRTKSTALTTPFDEIYGWELREFSFAVEGQITDENGEPLSDANIRMVGNDGTNARVKAKKDGTFRIRLNPNTEYVMLATSRGYLNQKNALKTDSIKSDRIFTVNFTLGSLFKPVTLENIFYDFAQWTLTPESETGLQALVKILTDNSNIAIELSAHTDYVGNNAANAELSGKRAQSVVDYLIKKGIAPARLTAKGYGEERPVVVDAALAKKYNFLKENESLNEQYILTLTPEQQTIANQINRRTEFRVTSTTYGIY